MRPYIDAHCHIGMTVSRDPVVGQSVGRCLARMASSGVAASIIFPTAGGAQARGVLDTRDQNEVISGACRLYPERFPIGLAIVEPRHQHAGVRELDRAMGEGGLTGFMVHPGLSGITLDGELHPFLEVAAMRKSFCFLHGRPAKIAAYAHRFPNVTFTVGAESQDAVRLCGPLENVWFEIAQRPSGPESKWDLAKLVSQFGRERILFGSDLPYYDFRVLQAQVDSANIDDETKDRIAYRNAISLIQQFRPDWELPMAELKPPQTYTDDEIWAARGERLL